MKRTYRPPHGLVASVSDFDCQPQVEKPRLAASASTTTSMPLPSTPKGLGPTEQNDCLPRVMPNPSLPSSLFSLPFPPPSFQRKDCFLPPDDDDDKIMPCFTHSLFMWPTFPHPASAGWWRTQSVGHYSLRKRVGGRVISTFPGPPGRGGRKVDRLLENGPRSTLDTLPDRHSIDPSTDYRHISSRLYQELAK